MSRCTIVMYHYVRELPYTQYPGIKGLLVSEFKEQLEYMSRHYKFVTIQQIIDAVESNYPIENNSALLTFDDGYIDHFTTVFPILEERGIQGSFFVPAKPIEEHRVLNINKIHFLLAAVCNIDKILNDIKTMIENEHLDFNSLWKQYAKPGRFDNEKVIFIKRLLQAELDEQLRNSFTDRLFKKHVTDDETAFAMELYMNKDQLKCMIRHGMHLGSHSYDHYWLNTLAPVEQEKQVDMSLKFLSEIGADCTSWTMCYPSGKFDSNLLTILKQKGCKLGFTVYPQIARVVPENALTLERLDTNDLPKCREADINSWTCKIMK